MSKETALAKLTGTTPPPEPVTLESDAPGKTNTPTQSTGAAQLVSLEGEAGTDVAAGDVEPKDDVTSRRFALFAKKEAALQKDREVFKKTQEEFSAKEKKVLEALDLARKFEELKTQGKGIEAMQALGFSETDIFNILSGVQPRDKTPQEIVTEELAKRDKADLEAKTKLQADEDARVLKRFRGSIAEHVKKFPDELEYCNHYGALAEELIFRTVDQVLKDDGEVISVDEAAKMVEEMYENGDKAMSNLKKRGPKAQALIDAAVETTSDEPLKAEVNPRPKTLTGAAQPTLKSVLKKPETRDQKRARLEESLRSGVFIAPKG